MKKNFEIAIVRTLNSPCRCAEHIKDGLNKSGYRASIFNSEDILFEAGHISEHYSLVIDHTDTFLGRGSLRSFVRFFLESKGARLVGAGAYASMIANDKYETKKRFKELNIPTPECILIDKNKEKISLNIEPPFIIKPVYEHMSRGITIAEDLEEAKAEANYLLNKLQQPVIIESYITGREIAVSVIDDVEKGLFMLPPLEWNIGPEEKYQNEDFKAVEHTEERKDVVYAKLSEKEIKLLRELVEVAFIGFGIRDYCRFDIKLSPEGKFFFLEVNISPSLEKNEAMAISGRWAGLTYSELLERIIQSAQKRYNLYCK